MFIARVVEMNGRSKLVALQSMRKMKIAPRQNGKTLFGSSKPIILLYTVCTLCLVKYVQPVLPGCNGKRIPAYLKN